MMPKAARNFKDKWLIFRFFVVTTIICSSFHIVFGGEPTSYNEVKDPLDGSVRSHYLGVKNVLDGLTPQQIQTFRTNAYEQAGRERNLYHIPRILTKQEHDFLKRAIEQRARALQAFFSDLNSGKMEVLKQGIIPPNVMQRFLTKSDSSLEKIKSVPWSRTGFFYGPDIVRNSDGTFYVLEDNTGDLGGMGDAVEARRDLLKFLPAYQSVLKDGGGESYAMTIANSLRKLASSSSDALVFIIPKEAVNMNKHLLRQLKKQGVYTVTDNGLVSQDEGYGSQYLDSRTGEVRLNFFSGNNHATRLTRSLKVGAVAIRGFYQAGFRQLFPNTYNAFIQGKVAMIGYKFTGFDMLADKELSIYTDSKLIPFYLHEEPLISYIPTKSFREVGSGGETIVKRALLDQVFKNLGHYVIKKTNGLQGNEVWIGSRLDANQAGRLRAAIAADPGRYIAQQFVPLSTVGDQITDLRVYTTVTKSDVRTSDYFWGRALSIRGDGRVNLHQNGQVIPVFFEGSDTVSVGNTHAPAAECVENNLKSSVGF